MKKKDKQERAAAAEAAREQAARIELEDQTPDAELAPDRLAAKIDRLRKREYRAREAEAKKAKQDAASYDSIEQYWQANKSRLTEEQRLGLEARQDYVLDLMLCMEHTLETGTTEQDLADLVDEVKEDVAKFGQCNSTILSIPRIWSEQEAGLRKRLEAHSEPLFPGEQLVGHINATYVLITYGMFVAVTERIYQDFSERFIVKRVPVPVYSELMKCTSCGREQNVGVAAVNDLRRLNRKFLCVLCGSEEQKSRAQATIVKPQITMGKEVIFDGRGYAHPETAFNPLRYVWDKDR